MATLTINTTSAQDTRIKAAFGKQLNLETTDDPPVLRDATGAEVKAYVIEFIKTTVLRQEQRAASQIASDGISEISPT